MLDATHDLYLVGKWSSVRSHCILLDCVIIPKLFNCGSITAKPEFTKGRRS